MITVYSDLMTQPEAKAKEAEFKARGFVTRKPYSVCKRNKDLTLAQHRARTTWQFGVTVPKRDDETTEAYVLRAQALV